MWGIFFIGDWCGRAQVTVDSVATVGRAATAARATPGQVALGCVEGQVMKVIGSKEVSSIPPWSLQ